MGFFSNVTSVHGYIYYTTSFTYIFQCIYGSRKYEGASLKTWNKKIKNVKICVNASSSSTNVVPRDANTGMSPRQPPEPRSMAVNGDGGEELDIQNPGDGGLF